MDPTISDTPIYFFPLSSWAYHHKLRQMIWIVQLGFELDVYAPDELAGLYWYLQYLVQTRIRHLERIRGFVTRRFEALREEERRIADDVQKVEEIGNQKLEFLHTLSFMNYEMLEATAKQSFADCLTCVFCVLQHLDLIETPPRPYSTDKMRYELRMKPFLMILLPELVPWENFDSLVKQEEESVSFLIPPMY
jgi:N-alpha-acetyltransferase 35, NatC auxiliary subunit